MGLGNNSSSKIRSANFESADHLEPEVRRVIQSLQDTVRNLQDEVNGILKNVITEPSVKQQNSPGLSIEGGQGIKVVSICNRRIISNTQQNVSVSSGNSINELVVVAEYSDYLECQTIVTSGDPATVYVAKPYSFRRSVFDGNTVNGISYTYIPVLDGSEIADNYRQAGDGNEYEIQRITPAYYQGERILVVDGVNTGVVVDDILLTMVDINFSGRCWAVHISGEYSGYADGDA